LIGVWYADLPAASQLWYLADRHHVRGWAFLGMPWLAGMVALFAFEFVEGNTVTRLYFMRLRRLSREALALGAMTPALAAARREHVPTFTHFLDIPLLFVIVALGAARPTTWMLFTVATVLSVLATAGPTGSE
jgi:hypothetical protein